jgi:hypothetical protein
VSKAILTLSFLESRVDFCFSGVKVVDFFVGRRTGLFELQKNLAADFPVFDPPALSRDTHLMSFLSTSGLSFPKTFINILVLFLQEITT